MIPPIPLREAQEQLLALAAPLSSETIPTHAANGRYLADPLTALRTQPPTDLSSMDGYAVCGTGPWTNIGESRGGQPFEGTLKNGQAIRISTGAVMPDGADRVLIQENAKIDGATITATSSPSNRQYVRRAGFDFTVKDHLLPIGTHMGPAQIALALSAGHSSLLTRQLPSLALIEGGDELMSDPVAAKLHSIPASNNAMLSAMCSGLTRDIQCIGPVSDTLEALGSALYEARGADIIVTTGGASVGDHDLVQPSLAEYGADIAFWRVAIKPGKPLLVATKGRQIILGLPGNPVSSFVTAFLFLLPLLRHLAGASAPLPAPLSAKLTAQIAAGGPRREFLRAIWDGSSVTPIPEQDSSALCALASANALIERPDHCDRTEAGTYVPFYLLKNGLVA